jgi:8-oxo-dGTP diphosphatase
MAHRPLADLARTPDLTADGPMVAARVLATDPLFRPGAYGVVFDADRTHVLLVRGWEGLFLPGGGVDPGETVLDALDREMREETGWAVRVLQPLGSAREFTHDTRADRHLEKHGHFFLCALDRQIGPRTEPDEIPRWVPTRQALSVMHHHTHGWAIGRGLVAVGDPDSPSS